jgi:glucose-6-phosphate 1-dehydrogenase
MSTTIATGAAARSGAAPAREQAAVASAARAGQTRGSVPRPDNHVIVVFGATGDLAHRKLLPGLFHLATAGLMPDRYQIIGVSPQDMTGEQFRDLARQAIADFGKVKPAGNAWQAFQRRLTFASADPAHTSPWPRPSQPRSGRSAARPDGCSTSRSRRRPSCRQ